MEITKEHIVLAQRIAQLSKEDKQALLTYLLSIRDIEDIETLPASSQD